MIDKHRARVRLEIKVRSVGCQLKVKQPRQGDVLRVTDRSTVNDVGLDTTLSTDQTMRVGRRDRIGIRIGVQHDDVVLAAVRGQQVVQFILRRR